LGFGAVLFGVAIVQLVDQAGEDPPRPMSAAEIRQQHARNFAFPDGSRQVLPGQRLVALYGAPGEPVLGNLGEHTPEQAVAKVKELAAQYQPLMRERVQPAFEIITTVAAAEPTSNGDHSREAEPATLLPWIEAARKAGVYVILDLQPGSTPFDEQAKQYAELLQYAHVGLALDPEWRIQPGKKHLEDIGSVSSDEVNRTAAWLAGLTRQNQLPQKVFLLHQFKLSMLPDRHLLKTNHPELATIIQMDGQGNQDMKRQTYAAITTNPPHGAYFGWKNFIDEDTPMLDPAQTMAQQPTPWLISYQ
jgi:hypothetical protein